MAQHATRFERPAHENPYFTAGISHSIFAVAWAEGRGDAVQGRPARVCRYSTSTLRGVYLEGYRSFRP